MAVGWFKLHRKIVESQVFSDADLLRLWVYLLAKANYKPSYFRGVEIHRGQVAFTHRVLADALDWSRGKLGRCLQKLASMESIAIAAGREFSVLTVCNYEAYQDGDDDQRDANGATNGATNGAAGEATGGATNGAVNGAIPKKVKSKEPPPTPSTDAEPAAASWEGVEGVLRSLGMTEHRAVIEKLQSDAATPAEAMDAIKHWQGKPGAWEVGGLVLRLQRWASGQAPGNGFPPPSEAYQRDEARRRRLADGDRIAAETLQRRQKYEAELQASIESRKLETVA